MVEALAGSEVTANLSDHPGGEEHESIDLHERKGHVS